MNTVFAMLGSHTNGYIKAMYTQDEWGIGAKLTFDDDGYEFAIFFVCFQIWIGKEYL